MLLVIFGVLPSVIYSLQYTFEKDRGDCRVKKPPPATVRVLKKFDAKYTATSGNRYSK